MLPTPDLSHLSRKDLESVYEPAEDTFALLDALEADAGVIGELKARLCVEIGSGSGCVSAFLAQIVGPSSSAFLCTDINAHAALCTARTGSQNKAPLSPLLCSLTTALHRRCRGRVDILLFNPPYVPTLEEEEYLAQAHKGIAGAWAGGEYGTKLVQRLIQDGVVQDLLAPKGRFYLVAIKQNDPHKLVQMLRDGGLDAEIALSRRAGREHLFIIRAIQPSS